MQGTGVIQDTSDSKSDHVYSDDDPKGIDAIPDSQPHREIDLAILKAVRTSLKDSAKVAIIMPPCIYGVGSGPFNRLSIQVPGLIRCALEKGKVAIPGKGEQIWNNVHVEVGHLLLLICF